MKNFHYNCDSMIELSNFYKICVDNVWWMVKCIKSHGNGFYTLIKVNEEDMMDGCGGWLIDTLQFSDSNLKLATETDINNLRFKRLKEILE